MGRRRGRDKQSPGVAQGLSGILRGRHARKEVQKRKKGEEVAKHQSELYCRPTSSSRKGRPLRGAEVKPFL